MLPASLRSPFFLFLFLFLLLLHRSWLRNFFIRRWPLKREIWGYYYRHTDRYMQQHLTSARGCATHGMVVKGLGFYSILSRSYVKYIHTLVIDGVPMHIDLLDLKHSPLQNSLCLSALESTPVHSHLSTAPFEIVKIGGKGSVEVINMKYPSTP